MSIMKRTLSFFVAICLVATSSISAFANEIPAQQNSLTANFEETADSYAHFEALSINDYIIAIAQYEGISYNEAANKVVKAHEEAIKKWGNASETATCSFDSTRTSYLGNGSTEFYGFVYFIDNQANGIYQIRYQCPASYVANHYGRYFNYVSDAARAYAYNSGPWEFNDSQCSVNTKKTNGAVTAVTLSYSGMISTKYSVPVSVGTDGDFFGVTGSVSTDYICRKYVSGSNTHALSQPS